MVFCEADADGVFGAFVVEFAARSEAVARGGVGVADGARGAIVGGRAFVADACFAPEE